MSKWRYGKVSIFAEKELSDYLESKKKQVISSIEEEKDDYLLNVNENDYINYKISIAEVEPLKIYNEQIYASSSEQLIPAEYFPSSFFVHRGKSYKKDVVKFHIPFSGDEELLKCIPSTRILWTIDIKIEKDEFYFEIINFSDNAESIVSEKDSIISSILQQYRNVKIEVERYNVNLKNQIGKAFEFRKNRIKAKLGVLGSLGIPIKRTSSSDTFSVPSTLHRRKVIFSKPLVEESHFVPEPCLDENTYFQILKLIHDVGKEFERLPSLYANKEEEHLRDHFLMMLEPNFEGSATGETFNKSGKTDILLRYQGSNVFIGECKFWHGKKGFLDTISQLLRYLTWRDSKAAIIMFVSNKDFSSVIKTPKLQ